MDKEKRMKVLVVEQDLGSRLAYVAIARSGGWEALSCDHYSDVIDLVRQHGIGALVTDHSRDFGFDTLRKLHDAGLSLPTILVTSGHYSRSEARQLGVETVLHKPPDVSALRKALLEVEEALRIHSDFAVIFRFLARCEADGASAVAHPSSEPYRVRDEAPRFVR